MWMRKMINFHLGGAKVENHGDNYFDGDISGTGCPASKSDLISGIRNAFGDMFLLGLGLMVVFAYGRSSHRS